MSDLAQYTVYLSGLIVPGNYELSSSFRKKVAGKFKAEGFRVLDPLRSKGVKLGSRNYNPTEILQRDIQDVLACKAAGCLFAVMLTKAMDKKISIGTPSEIAIAWYNHIPVIFVTDDEDLANHLWIRGMCGRVFLIKDDSQVDDVLMEAASYAINWYGPKAEQEVYAD